VAEAAPPPCDEGKFKRDIGVAEAAPPPYDERARPIRIMIASQPPSMVFLDGRRLGKTPVIVNQPLRPGKHLLRFVNPELGIDRRRYVQVTGKQNQLKVIENLESKKSR